MRFSWALLACAAAASGCRGVPVGGDQGRGVVVAQPTRDAGVARVALLGDTGESEEGQESVARDLAHRCGERGCDLVVLLGDMLGEDGPSSPDDPVLARKLEAPYRGLGVPVYLALGNHDYGGGGAGWEDDKAEHVRAFAARSGVVRFPSRQYRVDAGPLRLVVADTNAAMYGDDEKARAELATWLDEPGEGMRVAVGHHPILSNGDHGDAGRYDHVPSYLPVAPGRGVRDLVSAAVCGRADLYVAGHDHTQQWLTPTCQGTELAVSGAASRATHLHPRHPARFQNERLGFLYLEVTPRELRAEMVGEGDVTLFQRSIAR